MDRPIVVASPAMADNPSPSGQTWRHHDKRPNGDEVKIGDFTGNEAAVVRKREQSTAKQELVVAERYGLTDWQEVDVVDERR